MTRATSTDASPTQALTRSHGHLRAHRRLIVMRSIASGVASMTPVPYLDDWLAATIRRQTIRRLAEAHRVDLEPAAANAIADGTVPPPTWRAMLTASLIPRLLTRSLRKVLILWAAARRADETLRAFAVATMFDHYCARVHVGAGLDAAAGKSLRAQMDEVLRGAQSRVALRLFRRALVAAARAAARAPLELVDIASGGMLRRWRGGKDAAEAEAVEAVEAAVSRATATSFLGKLAVAVETALDTVGQTYVDDIVRSFEQRVKGAHV
jgi:hypothetical protein